MKIITFAVILLFSSLTFAGGYDFKIQVLSFSDKGNNEYILTFIDKSSPDLERPDSGKVIILHLRCKRSGCDNYTREHYDKSIALLRSQIEKSKQIKFGVMGRGYVLIPGTENEFQSNALEIFEQDNVVYSYYD